MTPPLQDCLKNPPVKDEVWDKCVRRSSIGIGIGGLLGAVSSVFLGAGGVFLSMGLCVTWAVKHCRALFREQARAKIELQQLPPCPKPCPKPALPVEEPCICEQEELPVCEPMVPVCEPALPICEPPIEEPPCSTFTFPPVFPIPDRPFGRVKKDKKEDSDECSCVMVEKCDEEDGSNYKLECTCPIPKMEGDESNKSEEIPDFSIECTTLEEPSPVSPPPQEPIEEAECTCPKIEEPVCTCPPPEPEPTKPSEPECTCD